MFKSLQTSLVIGLSIISLHTAAQVRSVYGRNYADELPKEWLTDVLTLRDTIYKIAQRQDTFGIPPKDLLWSSDNSAENIADEFRTGAAYSDWPEIDAYLKGFSQKILPQNIQDQITFYAVKGDRYNAYMTLPGYSFVYVSAFAQMEDESDLAGLILHEAAHYEQAHILEEMKRDAEGDFDNKLFEKKKYDRRKERIQAEITCDSLAVVWLKQAGASTSGVRKTVQHTSLASMNYDISLEEVVKFIEVTHPSSKRRIKNAERFIELHGGESDVNWFYNRKEFLKLREACRIETVKHALNNHNYLPAIEFAFKFHLENPNEVAYAHYLVEAIRRFCYLNPDRWSRNFITHNYFRIIRPNFDTGKKRYKEGIFEVDPKNILQLTDTQNYKALTSKYWETQPFATNEEAFNYFFKLAVDLGDKECYLSNALSLNFDENLSRPYLEKYLSFEDIRFREFATSLLNNTIYSDLPDSTMSVFAYDYLAYKLKKNLYVRVKNFEGRDQVMSYAKASTEATNRRYVYRDNLREKALNDYYILMQLHRFVNTLIISRSDEAKLYVLSPEYWEIMKYYGVNQIEFITLRYIENKRENLSFENIKTYSETSYQEMLSCNEGQRDMRAMLASMRIKENDPFKFRCGGPALSVKKGDATLDILQDYFDKFYRLAEQRQLDFDSRY